MKGSWIGGPEGRYKGDHRDHYERILGAEPGGPPVPGGLHSRAAALILSYRIFPPAVLTGVLARSPVEVGDTVGGAYHLIPGVDLFFASRVVDRFDREENGLWRTGFAYQTLTGHPELGEETFVVEKNLASGKITVALRSWSRAGTLLSQILSPMVRLLQVRASKAALGYLAEASGDLTPPPPAPASPQAAHSAKS